MQRYGQECLKKEVEAEVMHEFHPLRPRVQTGRIAGQAGPEKQERYRPQRHPHCDPLQATIFSNLNYLLHACLNILAHFCN